MVVPVISGSDKTTASVGTIQQEYHPIYVSIGNISITVQWSHSIGVLPVAFLPIPKGKWLCLQFINCAYPDVVSKSQQKNQPSRSSHDNYITNVWSLYSVHWSHTWTLPKLYNVQMDIFGKPSSALDLTLLTTQNKYGLLVLSKTGVQSESALFIAIPCANHVCRCDAKPSSLDDPGAHSCSHEKTDFLLKNFNPSILWDEFGIQDDIVVCGQPDCVCSSFLWMIFSAVHAQLSMCWHTSTSCAWSSACQRHIQGSPCWMG